MHIIFDDFVWQNNMHMCFTYEQLSTHTHTYTLTMRAIKCKADSLLPSAHSHWILCGFITLRFYMRNAMNKSVAWMISSGMIKSFDTVISSLRTRELHFIAPTISLSLILSLCVPLFLVGIFCFFFVATMFCMEIDIHIKRGVNA